MNPSPNLLNQPRAQKRKSREADDWKARKARWAERAVPFAVGLAMVSAASLFYFYSRQGQKLYRGPVWSWKRFCWHEICSSISV